jgi:hypothetical protein
MSQRLFMYRHTPAHKKQPKCACKIQQKKYVDGLVMQRSMLLFKQSLRCDKNNFARKYQKSEINTCCYGLHLFLCRPAPVTVQSLISIFIFFLHNFFSCAEYVQFVGALDTYSSGSVLEVVLDNDTVTKTQLWLLFFIKIFIEELYICIFFMKVTFKTNLFIWFSNFQTQWLKSYS